MYWKRSSNQTNDSHVSSSVYISERSSIIVTFGHVSYKSAFCGLLLITKFTSTSKGSDWLKILQNQQQPIVGACWNQENDKPAVSVLELLRTMLSISQSAFQCTGWNFQQWNICKIILNLRQKCWNDTCNLSCLATSFCQAVHQQLLTAHYKMSH